jgi:hypothetical protein
MAATRCLCVVILCLSLFNEAQSGSLQAALRAAKAKWHGASPLGDWFPSRGDQYWLCKNVVSDALKGRSRPRLDMVTVSDICFVYAALDVGADFSQSALVGGVNCVRQR